MNKISLKALIAPSFYNVHHKIKSTDYTHFWLKGGRGSTKSSFVSVEMIKGIMEDHEANGMAIMKVGNTLREAVFEQLVWAIEKLGVEHLWNIPHSKLLLTYIPTGQKIMFRGADKPKKIKGAKVAKGYFKFIWFEECDHFKGSEEIRVMTQSLMRGGEDFKIFYTFNPPKKIKNWCNQEVEQQKLRPDTVVSHTDYRSVPPHWLGTPFIVEAEHIQKTKPKIYEHEYLGISTGTGGEVFDNIISRRITDAEIKTFDKNREGLDWGYAADPFSWLRMNLDSTRRRLFIYDEVYQVKLRNIQAAKKIIKKRELNKIPLKFKITCDSAEPKSVDDFKEYGLIGSKGAKKGPGSIEHGMKWLEELEEIIIDPERCPNAYREFTGYELEKDAHGNFKSGYPDKDNHTIDATRYALEEDMAKKKKLRIRQLG